MIGDTVRVVIDSSTDLLDGMKLSIDSCSLISNGGKVNLVTNNVENKVLNGLVSMLNSTSNSTAEFQWHVFSIGNNKQVTGLKRRQTKR